MRTPPPIQRIAETRCAIKNTGYIDAPVTALPEALLCFLLVGQPLRPDVVLLYLTRKTLIPNGNIASTLETRRKAVYPPANASGLCCCPSFQLRLLPCPPIR